MEQRPGTLASLFTLAIPVLAGIVYMAASGAPRAYLASNAVALVLALAWVAGGRGPCTARQRRLLASALLAILALPNLLGPEISGVARWVPLGPVMLHAGMLALPPLVVLAAREPDDAPPVLLAALLLTLLQPDAAGALAITFAAVGVHHVTKDWRMGVVAIAGFVAMLTAAMRGELPPHPFVDRVLVEAAGQSPLAALGLFLATLAGFLLILLGPALRPAERLALAGSLFGFAVMALMSNYPSPLIGHGAAPIIGYGLALGFRQESRA